MNRPLYRTRAEVLALKRAWMRDFRANNPELVKRRKQRWNGANRLYRIYKCMKSRCKHRSNPSFDSYGGRGITVCERWAASFHAFAHDMGEPPSNRHSIERVESDGNYEPGNCRWATPKEQAGNRSNNRHITAFGETKLAVDWASDKRCTVKEGTLRARIRSGWEPERAITKASQRRVR